MKGIFIKQTSTIGKAASLFICGLLLFGISFLYGKMEQRYGGTEQ